MVSAEVAPAEPLAVLCGPTAVGKTPVGVVLAERLGAEIVVADSRTVYRGMDIGTAKPEAALRRRIPHHLLDVAEPEQTFTVWEFQRLARQAIAEIRTRGRLPLLVGGTGLYIRAVVDAFEIPTVPPNPALRASLEAEERQGGPGRLHARLAAVDPVAAARIHPHNLRRLTRALEVALSIGGPVSSVQRMGRGFQGAAMVGLTAERPQLHRRIEARIAEQLTAGLVDEVRALLDRGVPDGAPAMQGLGYKEIVGWLRGAYGYDEAIRRLARNTRRYAKRQLTWFRRDLRIRWVAIDALGADALAARAHAIMDAEFARQRRG